MKLLCISDMVDPALSRQLDPERYKDIDLVISCGDLPPEYLSSLRWALNVPLLYVRGNHDIRYDQKPPEGCINLHNRIVRHGSLKILGLEGSRWYNGGPIQYTETQMRRLVWRLRPRIWFRGGIDMVVSHASPRFIHDAEDRCHRGFAIYRKLIDWYQPRYFLHGHIHAHFDHDAQRTTSEGDTKVINCFGTYQVEIDEKQLAR
jgi:Icc-related predicted phosphoesterase